jgi:hypothetical protein
MRNELLTNLFKMNDVIDFQQSCNNKKCLRNTIYNAKTCKQIGKQERCYEKYLRKTDKDKEKRQVIIEDKEWKEALDIVHKRDKTCTIWKILTIKEREYIINNHFEDYRWLSKTLDGAHIFGRNNVKLKYNADNVLLINRYFHRLLTDHKDPVTQKGLSKEEVISWYIRAFNFVHGESIKNEQELMQWLTVNSN